MAPKRTLGYIQNEWTCPNCGGRNKGAIKTCENCGAPQPENVQFELGADQKFVTDEEQIKSAQAGADIHCGFCGTRNPATAETCSQCGGNLKEGKAREAGRVMQAPPPPPKTIKCNNCGTDNPGTSATCASCGAALQKPEQAQANAVRSAMATGQSIAQKKPNWKAIGGIIGALALCCIVIAVLFLIPTKSLDGKVTSVHWETYVPVQEIRAVDYNNKRGNPPSDAYNVSCHNESQEVCEQKTIDKGNGYSEVVEDCHTQTDKYCSYTIDEWTTIQTYTLDGNDLQPIYDSPSIASGQRLGDQTEELTVNFSTEDGPKTYSPETVSEFQQFTVGSTWTIKLNAMGGVVSVAQ